MQKSCRTIQKDCRTMQDLNALMERSCDWVRVYLSNPNSDVRAEDRHLCDGTVCNSSVTGLWGLEDLKDAQSETIVRRFQVNNPVNPKITIMLV